jgi:hypothetical protein
VAAVVVLVPAVPLLVLSVAALAVFYTMPARFNAWLSRLPGDDLLRTALIFAPATLLAIIVMAVLYANDAPRREAIEATRPSRPRPELRRRQRGGLARASLWISLPALMLVATAHLIAFVAPERTDRLLQALPATPIVEGLFNVSPYLVLLVVAVGLAVGFAPGGAAAEPAAKPGRGWTTARIARLGAILILVPSLALLVLSGAGLVWVNASSESLAWLVDRLPAETLLRLGLMFAPAMLLGVILLAGLYLAVPAGSLVEGRRTKLVREEAPGGDFVPPARPVEPASGLRSGLALGVLVAGLGFTALAGMATLAAVVFVLAAR